MAYEPFTERFGEFAWKETRTMTVFEDPGWRIMNMGLSNSTAMISTAIACVSCSPSFLGILRKLWPSSRMGRRAKRFIQNDIMATLTRKSFRNCKARF
jgi:hypothetical protein